MQKKNNNRPELRQDPVSKEWVLVSTGRAGRPTNFSRTKKEKPSAKGTCPFEDPQKGGNGAPLVWFAKPGIRAKKAPELKDWFVQVIRNKYPAVTHHYNTCPVLATKGMESTLDAIGFHEVIVTRPHDRSLAQMTAPEVMLVLEAYQERMRELRAEKCLKYILIFHNHGREAGASLYHPHSQLIALPIVPIDVQSSLEGSAKYYADKKRCVHCDIIKWELKQKVRVICENKSFIVVAPYAPRVAFELRVYPKAHHQHFDHISDADRALFADTLQKALKSLYKGLGDIAYNFFIHTAPLGKGQFGHYHWHIEILPRTGQLAGVELGTGLEVVVVSPEETAKFLLKHIN